MRYPAYPRYKPSGIEWLGDVPEHWETKRLKYSASINDETLPETTDPEFEISYVDISSVDARQGIASIEEMTFDNAPSRARRIVRDGDTIVSTVRTYLRAIAPIRKPKSNLIVSTGFAVVRPRAIESRFLSYALRETRFVETVMARSVGVSYPAVNASDIGTITLAIPPSDEQHCIADFLDAQTAKIDTLLAKKRELIEKLKEKRTALISRTVTCGLPPEAARAIGQNPNPKLKSSGIEWVGDVPEQWRVCKIKHLAQVRQGVTKGRDLGSASTIDLPYLRVANVQEGYLDLDEITTISILPSEIERYSLQEGDVLMNEGGDNDKLGRGAVWNGQIAPCLHQNHVFCVRPKQREMSEWIELWMQGAAAKAYFLLMGKQTTNLASISSSSIKELPIVVPPVEDRNVILKFITQEVQHQNQMIDKIEEAIDRLQEYRAALITAAVTGKIDVREATA